MKKVLIVENDRQLATLLESMIKQLSYECLVSHSLSEAYKLLERERPDLVLLDRLLPDGDGLELATYMHESFFTMRIICISTLRSNRDRITGLENGVDDYLSKPFSLKELELRLKRLLYCEKVLEQSCIRIGSLRFFPHSGTVLGSRILIQLRKKEAAILSCLCRHKNQVVSREEIVSYVWQGETAQPALSTLDVYVRRIRGKLEQHANILRTVRGYGYSITVA